MKNPTLLCSLSFIFSLGVLTSCNQSGRQLRDIKDDSMDYSHMSEEETNKYLRDMESYKLKAASQIEKNELQITKMKQAASQDGEAVKRKNLGMLYQFERQNNDLKIRMNDYTGDGPSSWYAFKAEFSSDMKTLENTMKLFGEKTSYLND